MQFYEVSDIQGTYGLIGEDFCIAEYQFTQSAIYQQYERSVYNLLDVTSTLGGLFSSLNVIGLIFTRIFSYNLMLSSIIRKLYHFKPKFESEVKKKKNKGGKNKKKKKPDDDDDMNEKLMEQMGVADGDSDNEDIRNVKSQM